MTLIATKASGKRVDHWTHEAPEVAVALHAVDG
jgi:hypothetical protein